MMDRSGPTRDAAHHNLPPAPAGLLLAESAQACCVAGDPLQPTLTPEHRKGRQGLAGPSLRAGSANRRIPSRAYQCVIISIASRLIHSRPID